MAKYEVKTEFVFKGNFKVEAETPQEAVRKVKENCGLTLGRDIHTNSPENEIDWVFSMHAEKRINNVNLIK